MHKAYNNVGCVQVKVAHLGTFENITQSPFKKKKALQD
jgi:hypothetical protein